MSDEHIQQKPPRTFPARLLRRLFFTLLWLCLIAAGLVFWDASHFLRTPGCSNEEPPLAVLETWYREALKGVPPWEVPTKAPSEPTDVIIRIEPGATFIRVAWDLKKAGAITNVSRFLLLGKYENALGSIKAGEYLVNTGWTPEQVLVQITKGRALLYRLSLREGLTWWETADAVEEQGFAKAADFSDVLRDPEFLAANHIPFADAEGFLFPETYLLSKPKALDKAQARALAQYLVDSFWIRTEAVWSRLPVKEGGKSVERRYTTSGDLIRPARSGARTAPATGNAVTPATGNAVTPAPGNATLPAGGDGTPPSSYNATRAAGGNAGPQAGNGTFPDETAIPAPTGGTVVLIGPAGPGDVDPEALKRLIILASLVEKETAVPEERARVAGVYAKRLQLGMLLQCDPTIIYGVGPSFSGAIKKSQLEDTKNRYNTYIHPGLPPGPICSSGLASLKAALEPEEHDFLYFVATGTDGRHVFSKNLNDHNKAVQEYRRTQGR